MLLRFLTRWLSGLAMLASATAATLLLVPGGVEFVAHRVLSLSNGDWLASVVDPADPMPRRFAAYLSCAAFLASLLLRHALLCAWCEPARRPGGQAVAGSATAKVAAPLVASSAPYSEGSSDVTMPSQIRSSAPLGFGGDLSSESH